jgi:glycosyltransferase involved in cell wall biosynthesis
MKIALVHDHLIQDGGAERVLEVFHDMWPDAPIFTLLYDRKKFAEIFPEKNIKTSFLQKLPGALNHYQWFLPMMPMATESYDLSEYDMVLSSSSAMAKGVLTQSNTTHICYCHTPTRYLWSDTHRYVEELKHNFIVKRTIPFTLSKLRMWDQHAAQRVDTFVANSKNVSDRIKKYYRRTSKIIHPPVETQKFSISPKVENYFLTGGRLVTYKRFDIAIKAFNRLGVPLKIFGTGPEEKKLREIAKPHIEFLGKVDQKTLTELYSKASAFIHPQVEDFGITVVESMAAGRPVVAFAAGGACETVVDQKTGKFFYNQDWEALADTIVRLKLEDFSPQTIKNYAEQFSTDRFKQEINGLVDSEWKKMLDYQVMCGYRQDHFNIF